MPPLPTLPINPKKASHRAWLNSIQGNIVKGHGREFTRLVFFRFKRVSKKNIELLTAALAAKLVTSAGEQYRQARRFKRTKKHEPFFSLGFTEEFFWVSSLELFPPAGGEIDDPARSNAFYRGMKGRLLNSGGAEPETEDQWDGVYRKAPHGVWLLAHAEHAKLDAMERRVVKLLNEHHAVALDPAETGGGGGTQNGSPEEGRRWSDDEAGKIVREPFGFRDGLSQMDFFKPLASTPLHARIGLDQAVITAGRHAGGSFLVLRKLDQNVKAFRDFETAMREAYRVAKKKYPADEPGSLLVGRERDGRPLATHRSGAINDFDFEADNPSARCPFHAHIRKANPRTTDVRATDNVATHKEAQFVRRSVVYDERNQLPKRSAADYVGGGEITGGVGLLFMGYMRDIELQFERLHRQWFDSVDFPFVGTGLGDPLIRGATGGAGEWSWNGIKVEGLKRFVRSRGGAYFYVPSIDWLRSPTS